MAPGIVESAYEASACSMKDAKNLKSKAAPDDMYGRYHPAEPDTLNLESNFGPMEPASIGYLQPTSANTPLDIMHERFEKDGYLFVSIGTKDTICCEFMC